MHVGLIIYGSLETRTGGFLYDRMLVRELEKLGDKLTIFSLAPGSYGRHLTQNFQPRLLAQLASTPLDILLQDELNHPSLVLINHWLRSRGQYPILSIVHHLRSSERHSLPLLHFYRWLEKRYIHTVDGLICNSLATYRAVTLLRQSEIPNVIATPGRDHVRPNTTAEQIKARALAAGPLHILFLGSITPRKGLHWLLSALESLPECSCKLTIAGDPDADRNYFRQIQDQVRRGALQDRVTFLGPRTKLQVEQLFANAHVLAVPSQHEGFGIVYLEAMGYGIPPIASASGGAGELITNEKDGYLIPPGDVQRLKGSIMRFCTDRQHLYEMSLAARRRYDVQPTWADTTAQIRTFMLERIPY